MGFACPVGTPCLAAVLLPPARGAHPGPNLWLISVRHPTPARALGSPRALGGGTWLSPEWGGHRRGGRGGQCILFNCFFETSSAHPPASHSPPPSHSNSSQRCPHLTLLLAPLPPSPVFSLPSSFCSSSSPAAVAHSVCVCAHVSCLCHFPCPLSQSKNASNKFIFHLKTERSICLGSICSLNCFFLSLLGKRPWSGQMAFRGSYWSSPRGKKMLPPLTGPHKISHQTESSFRISGQHLIVRRRRRIQLWYHCLLTQLMTWDLSAAVA